MLTEQMGQDLPHSQKISSGSFGLAGRDFSLRFKLKDSQFFWKFYLLSTK
jgi:hypothetical protein